MDSATLQAKYSGDIAFRGGADTQGGLPFGSHPIAAGRVPAEAGDQHRRDTHSHMTQMLLDRHGVSG